MADSMRMKIVLMLVSLVVITGSVMTLTFAINALTAGGKELFSVSRAVRVVWAVIRQRSGQMMDDLKVADYFDGANAQAAEAIRQGQNHALEELLKKGTVAVNHSGRDGMTLLYWAYGHANRGAMELLLTHGADPDLPFRNGDGDEQLLALIAASAAQNPQPEILELLLRHHANPNATDRGTPALMLALDSPEIVNILLLHGADVNLTDSAGVSPLGRAALNRRWVVALSLLEHGARIESGSDALNKIAFSFSHYPISKEFPAEHAAQEKVKEILAERNLLPGG